MKDRRRVVFLACILLVQGCAAFKELSFSEYQTVRRKLAEEVEKPGSRLRDARGGASVLGRLPLDNSQLQLLQTSLCIDTRGAIR